MFFKKKYNPIKKNSSPNIALSGQIELALKAGDINIMQLNNINGLLSSIIFVFYSKQQP